MMMFSAWDREDPLKLLKSMDDEMTDLAKFKAFDLVSCQLDLGFFLRWICFKRESDLMCGATALLAK